MTLVRGSITCFSLVIVGYKSNRLSFIIVKMKMTGHCRN